MSSFYVEKHKMPFLGIIFYLPVCLYYINLDIEGKRYACPIGLQVGWKYYMEENLIMVVTMVFLLLLDCCYPSHITSLKEEITF